MESLNRSCRNIDRIFAIWQAVHPTSYVTQQVNEAGTFTQAPGSMEDINTRKTHFMGEVRRRFADVGSFNAVPRGRQRNILYVSHRQVHATIWLLVSGDRRLGCQREPAHLRSAEEGQCSVQPHREHRGAIDHAQAQQHHRCDFQRRRSPVVG